MSDTIDFDALRPERKPKKISINHKTYLAGTPSMGTLIEAVEAANAADEQPMEAIAAVRTFMVEIFGADAEQEILYGLDQNDYAKLIEVLINAYADEGKAQGSSAVSRSAGTRSKRTSKGSTASISAKRASVQNGSVPLASHA